MVHWTCDRCNQAVEGEPMTLLVSASLAQQQPIVVHLCGGCRESFGAWLTAAAPVTPETPKEKDHAGG